MSLKHAEKSSVQQLHLQLSNYMRAAMDGRHFSVLLSVKHAATLATAVERVRTYMGVHGAA